MSSYVEVTKEQAYMHSLRLFRSISEWKTSGNTDMKQVAHDVLALAYFLVPQDQLLFAAGDISLADDWTLHDMAANLIAAAQLVNPDGPPMAAVHSGVRGPMVQAAMRLILAWLKEEGIEDVVLWVINFYFK